MALQRRTTLLSRRDALRFGTGMIALGAGFAVIGAPVIAEAGPASLQIHFFKKVGSGFAQIGSIPLPAELAANLRSANLEQVRMRWHRQAGQNKVQLAEHALPAAKQLAAAFAKKQ